MDNETPPNPPAATPPAAAAPPAAPLPQAAAPAQAPPSAPEPPAIKRVVVGEEEEIPSDATVIELTQRALRGRTDRASRAFLKQHFGTDDPETVKAKLKALEKLEEEKEVARRKALTSEEKLKEDLRREKARSSQWQRRFERVVTKHSHEKAVGTLAQIAGEHIKPKYFNEAVQKAVATHLVTTYSKRELQRLERTGEIKAKLGEFFKGYVAEHPEIGIGYEDAIRGGAPRKQPLNNGADANARPAPPKPGANAGEKSFAPSAENPMTAQEAREAARAMGLSFD